MFRKLLIRGISVLALCAALVWLSGVAAALLAPGPVRVPERAEIAAPTPLQPGDTVTAVARVSLPADLRIAAPELTGNGIIPLTVECRCAAWRWNRREWDLVAKFRVLKTGKISGLALKFSVRKPFSARKLPEHAVALPEIAAELDAGLVPGAELLLADAVPRPDAGGFGRRHWFWLIPVLLLIAAAAVFHFRRRRKKELPPWARALAAIARLRREAERREFVPEAGFARLCEIVRDDLELRFQLPAPRRTTQEFMAALRDEPALPEEERNFLRRFLAAADLIKFAKASADRAAFEEAARRAEELIRATAEKEERR
ncbi:MAG: hypothetical protein MR051_09195 [Lentisphaeria bacterium]|nr:hypothetical protein [Lentisphaeria bacterium]